MFIFVAIVLIPNLRKTVNTVCETMDDSVKKWYLESFLTEEYLDEVEMRLKAVTPWPWKAKGEGKIAGWGSNGKHPGYDGHITAVCGQSIIQRNSFIPVCGATPAECESNAILIAHAPTDINALLTEVRKLREWYKTTEYEIQRLRMWLKASTRLWGDSIDDDLKQVLTQAMKETI